MFLEQSDYQVQVRNWLLNILTDDGEMTAILEKAELMAQKEMESYLNQRYDVTAIFSAIGVERDELILMYIVDIAIYNLHANIQSNDIPEFRQTRYDNAKDWLKMVKDGSITPNLPILEEDGTDPEDSFDFQGGSNESTTHRY